MAVLVPTIRLPTGRESVVSTVTTSRRPLGDLRFEVNGLRWSPMVYGHDLWIRPARRPWRRGVILPGVLFLRDKDLLEVLACLF